MTQPPSALEELVEEELEVKEESQELVEPKLEVKEESQEESLTQPPSALEELVEVLEESQLDTSAQADIECPLEGPHAREPFVFAPMPLGTQDSWASASSQSDSWAALLEDTAESVCTPQAPRDTGRPMPYRFDFSNVGQPQIRESLEQPHPDTQNAFNLPRS